MNVIKALKTMRDDMELKRIGVPYRATLDQCISQLERAEVEAEAIVHGALTAHNRATAVLRQIVGGQS